MKKIYLSGPMSGLPDFNRSTFNEAKAILTSAGFDVWSPADLNESNVSPFTWINCMKKCIAAMMDCDIIMQLPGWEESRGANIEAQLGQTLCMDFSSWELFELHAKKVSIATASRSLTYHI